MVVVTLQYRLGMLGFLRQHAMGINGNMGLLDIIQALSELRNPWNGSIAEPNPEFIQSTISLFGGNPNLITLAGQSSGADLIKTLLTTSLASNLFQRAILHSAPLNYGDQPIPTAEAVGDLFMSYLSNSSDSPTSSCAKLTGPAGLACLQKAKIGDLLSAQDDTFKNAPYAITGVSAAEPIRPVLDGSLVSSKGFMASLNIQGGLTSTTRQLIFTTVTDEAGATIAGVSQNQVIPYEYYDAYVQALAGANVAAIVQNSNLYEPDKADPDAARDELNVLGTDWIWRW